MAAIDSSGITLLISGMRNSFICYHSTAATIKHAAAELGVCDVAVTLATIGGLLTRGSFF